MHKQTTRKSGRGIIRNDIAKIKAILATTAKDVRKEARRALSDSYEVAKDRTADLNDNVAEIVGTQPYKSLAIALFSGLAFGMVAMRKKRRFGRR